MKIKRFKHINEDITSVEKLYSTGHSVEHKKGNIYERLLIDVTDFYNGYGDFSSIEKHLKLLTELKNDGWKNVGTNHIEYKGLDNYELEVVRKL